MLFKEVVVIGKIVILSLEDSEEHIIDRVKELLEDENGINYSEIVPNQELAFGDLRICLKEQTVYRNGKKVSLSHQEFLVLQFLTKHPGWIFTKEQIYDVACGENIIEDLDNAVYCLIRDIRKKLEPDPHHPKYIQTVRGVGYKFVIPEE